jgi:hypothetical protein
LLTIRTKAEPDGWGTFNAMSLLGGSLLEQTKYADAAPLLADGYRGLKERESRLPPEVRQLRLREALDRLVRLAEATDRPAETTKWRAEYAALPAEPAPPPRAVR